MYEERGMYEERRSLDKISEGCLSPGGVTDKRLQTPTHITFPLGTDVPLTYIKNSQIFLCTFPWTISPVSKFIFISWMSSYQQKTFSFVTISEILDSWYLLWKKYKFQLVNLGNLTETYKKEWSALSRLVSRGEALLGVMNSEAILEKVDMFSQGICFMPNMSVHLGRSILYFQKFMSTGQSKFTLLQKSCSIF